MSRRFEKSREPKWFAVQGKWHKQPNPPSRYRKAWREQARAQQNHRLRACRDLDELVIETKIQKLTSIYDWY